MLLKIKIKRMKTSTNKDELKRDKLKNKRNVCGNNYTLPLLYALMSSQVTSIDSSREGELIL